MLESTVQLGQAFLSGVWRLFSITVPGFTFTVGQMSIGFALIGISITAIRILFGLGGSGDTHRTSSTNNPKISDKRKGDEF